mmetsp:Transcript_17017/g.19672  ORF Transcript_17017/g.19672 Transcript_17017/m.19672 type:complete len:111 (+) Transcript_17017:387-719(+)
MKLRERKFRTSKMGKCQWSVQFQADLDRGAYFRLLTVHRLSGRQAGVRTLQRFKKKCKFSTVEFSLSEAKVQLMEEYTKKTPKYCWNSESSQSNRRNFATNSFFIFLSQL